MCPVGLMNAQAQGCTQQVRGMKSHLLSLPGFPIHGRNSPSGFIPMALWILSFQSRCFVPRSNQGMPGMQASWATCGFHICTKYRAKCTYVHLQVCACVRCNGRQEEAKSQIRSASKAHRASCLLFPDLLSCGSDFITFFQGRFFL